MEYLYDNKQEFRARPHRDTTFTWLRAGLRRLPVLDGRRGRAESLFPGKGHGRAKAQKPLRPPMVTYCLPPTM